MATKQDVLDVLALFAAHQPWLKPLPDNKTTLYCYLLADIDGDILRMAAFQIMATEKLYNNWPMESLIRDHAVQLDRRINAVPSAAEAWNEVLDAPKDGKLSWIDRENSKPGDTWVILEDEYKFTHPLVEKVARNMGWPRNFFTDLLAADRARFIQAYEVQIDSTTAEALSLPEVRQYTAGQLKTGDAIKQLVKGMVVK